MLKRKKVTVQRSMQSASGDWTSVVRIDGTKIDISLKTGRVELPVGKRLSVEGSGTSWEVV